MRTQDLFLVAGLSDQSLQTLINRCASSGMWGLIIPANYKGTDGFTNPGNIAVIDLRTNGTGLGGILNSGASGNAPLIASVRLTNSQLLNLSTVPAVIIPSPGPGKYISPQAISFELSVGTVAFNISGGSGYTYVYWGGLTPSTSQNATYFPDSIGQQGMDYVNADSQLLILPVYMFSGSVDLKTGVENQPLLIKMDDTLSVGNGTLLVTVSYTIETA